MLLLSNKEQPDQSVSHIVVSWTNNKKKPPW